MLPLPEEPEADAEGPAAPVPAAEAGEEMVGGVVELVMQDSLRPTTDRYQSVFILVSAPPGTSAVVRPHW